MVRSASSLSYFSRHRISARACAGALLIAALWVTGPVSTAHAASEADEAVQATMGAGTQAQPVVETPPVYYPPSAEEEGREGWVRVSYVIEADGNVSDVFIEDSVGGADFEQLVREAVKTWRYEPATLGGEPTVQTVSWRLITFSWSAQGKGERGNSSEFRRSYRRVMKSWEREDVEKAIQQTNELAQSPGLNLYEASSLEVLASLISRDQGDDRAELQHLDRAAIDSGAYLESGAYDAILLRMFALQVELGRYADALATYDTVASRLGERHVSDTMKKVASQVQALSQADATYSVPGVIGEAEAQYEGQGAASQHLLRRLVGFASESFDGLAEYDLRCDFRRVKGTPKPERAVRIPEEWGDCRMYVYGSPGTEFQFVQYVAPSS